ncbi:MAG: NAD(P)/FAD-dependent oxidoreductase [Pirellulales bacterium]
MWTLNFFVQTTRSLPRICHAGINAPWDVIVVGAGAAGLIAAEQAASVGKKVGALERNSRPGVKILMSGGTRCNLTHHTDKWGTH